MKTTIEYNSKLAVGDEVYFYLDGEKIVGHVKDSNSKYWIDLDSFKYSHSDNVDKVFSSFGVTDRYEFRNKVIGHNYERLEGIWPYVDSLEELKKMLDRL